MKEVAEAAAAPPPPAAATTAGGVRAPERRLFMLNRLLDTILHAPERCAFCRSKFHFAHGFRGLPPLRPKRSNTQRLRTRYLPPLTPCDAASR